MLASVYGQGNLALGIHDIDRCNGREAVVGSGFQVIFGIGTSATVGRVALDNGTVYLLYKIFDKGRLQEVMTAWLAGR